MDTQTLKKHFRLWGCFLLFLIFLTGCMSKAKMSKDEGGYTPLPASTSEDSTSTTSDDIAAVDEDAEASESRMEKSKSDYGSDKKAKVRSKIGYSKRRSSPKKIPSASGLKAGFADDNKQYGFFLDFLKKFRNAASRTAAHRHMDVSERIIINISDK